MAPLTWRRKKVLSSELMTYPERFGSKQDRLKGVERPIPDPTESDRNPSFSVLAAHMALCASGMCQRPSRSHPSSSFQRTGMETTSAGSPSSGECQKTRIVSSPVNG